MFFTNYIWYKIESVADRYKGSVSWYLSSRWAIVLASRAIVKRDTATKAICESFLRCKHSFVFDSKGMNQPLSPCVLILEQINTKLNFCPQNSKEIENPLKMRIFWFVCVSIWGAASNCAVTVNFWVVITLLLFSLCVHNFLFYFNSTSIIGCPRPWIWLLSVQVTKSTTVRVCSHLAMAKAV